MHKDALLCVQGLTIAFLGEHGQAEVVRRVSFDLQAGETLGLVGESGCGKSTTVLASLGLLPPGGRVVEGSVFYGGRDLLSVPASVLRRVRGQKVGMIFQDSMTSLNPVLTVGRQISEMLERHLGIRGRPARRRVVELLEEVGIPEPEQRSKQFPHQLSGGLRQRVAIAIALAANPDVLFADEPTTALDVTVQAQLLDLLIREQKQRQMALLLITHDLGVVAGVADRVAVMYAGRIVEEGPTEAVFGNPRHPYTLGLLRSAPRVDREIAERLPFIPGAPPAMWAIPPGCPFRPRCAFAFDKCVAHDPELSPTDAEAHRAACWADIRVTSPP